ncbi:oxygen-independent coproporphyrinogen III oxidase [Brackiella oedipodis]|uniref:oxygen-independent coproporphyrinogen III oxidase n=1 Tax=Brackiella oedipodis TaxID=124225 RepID=UPI00048E18B2|nr:oxygen-independent coproporphyrinogen III oxidase [Brackiella oedipodis]
MDDLINKYNVPGPRYTSYPTVPYWDEASFSPQAYLQTLQRSFNESNDREGISLYIHLPYCESLCTFCACNKRITKKHSVEGSYIDAVIHEWDLYLQVLGRKPLIREIHLGGGTPTFFAPEQLRRLLEHIYEHACIAEPHAFSFEGHPNNTTYEHMQTLYELGFRRVSFGVQDYNPKVQIAIHRVQPFEHVQRVTEQAREIGYTSVNHDLVFGLPFQTWASMQDTIRRTISLKPDRLAFYSYAHVPWLKGVGQRGFDEKDLPTGEEKRALYEKGKQLFLDLGYVEIGMDHFSLPEDELYQSLLNRHIHRNFMGYSSSSTQVMIGLGVSSISDTWYGFGQNEKVIEDYYAKLEANQLPLVRGHLLTAEDLIIRRHILNLMCRLETSWQDPALQFAQLPQVLSSLQEMQQDGLINITEHALSVTEKGRPYVRNVCMAFDLRMLLKKPETRIFSMTV